MSAIWGYLSYTNAIPAELPSLMEAPYHTKCSIDRYEAQQNGFLHMGCGIQYITQEAQREVLPVFDAGNGIFFTADCILDNRKELISLLSAAGIAPSDVLTGIADITFSNNTLATATDTALPDGTLMYLAYKKWGIDCLSRFRGLFSMAVYDAKARTLFLAADQTASRCLYYYKTGDSVCFSTLLEPIRKIFPSLTFNELYLKDYLTAPGLMPNIVPTETPYTGVYKINPGYCVEITQSGVTEHVYYSPFDDVKRCQMYTKKTPQQSAKHSAGLFSRHSAKAYGKAFRALYTDCVKDALRTDGEVGISMSSGLDSASVGALAATLLREKGKPLYSYTYVPCITPEPDKNKDNVHDETDAVLKIAEMHPNIKTRFLNNEGKNCLEFLPQGLDFMEIPYKAIINLPNLCEVYGNARKEGCRVVLTGQTGNATVSHGYIDDVLFDDYRRGHFPRFLSCLNNHSRKVKLSRKKELQACIRYFRHAKKVYAAEGIRELTPDNPFLDDTILEGYPYPERYARGELPFLTSVPIDRTLYPLFLYNKATLTYLGELDTKLGLAAGVVLRDPTRDPRLLEFCAELPYHMFAYRGTPRWLIRGNFSDLLPACVLDNFMRYGVQNSDWMQRIRRDWATLCPKLITFFDFSEQNAPQKAAPSDMIDRKKVEDYLHSLADTGPDNDVFRFECLIFTALFLRFTGR
ncbi:MAG: hypothetical protein IJ427_07165 [Lachnospiraceae bacterium]|nr:hypothetical protein [Lachnospiraceae bacterium]